MRARKSRYLEISVRQPLWMFAVGRTVGFHIPPVSSNGPGTSCAGRWHPGAVVDGQPGGAGSRTGGVGSRLEAGGGPPSSPFQRLRARRHARAATCALSPSPHFLHLAHRAVPTDLETLRKLKRLSGSQGTARCNPAASTAQFARARPLSQHPSSPFEVQLAPAHRCAHRCAASVPVLKS